MPSSRRPVALALVACGLAAVTACAPASSGVPHPSGLAASGLPTATPPGSLAATGTNPAVTAPPQAIPTQSETAWGRIWDELPVDFPRPAVAATTQLELHPGASGAFELAADPTDVATAMQDALELGGFSTESMSGPFEDGSIVIESVGPTTTACRVRTTVAPSAGGTRVTVLYGTACPFGSTAP